MNEETKQLLHIQLEMLSKTLQKTGTVIGIMVNKKDFNKSKIVFCDCNSLQTGVYKGFSVSVDELNKGILQGI